MSNLYPSMDYMPRDWVVSNDVDVNERFMHEESLLFTYINNILIPGKNLHISDVTADDCYDLRRLFIAPVNIGRFTGAFESGVFTFNTFPIPSNTGIIMDSSGFATFRFIDRNYSFNKTYITKKNEVMTPDINIAFVANESIIDKHHLLTEGSWTREDGAQGVYHVMQNIAQDELHFQYLLKDMYIQNINALIKNNTYNIYGS